MDNHTKDFQEKKAVLTAEDIDALNVLARDLAQRSFGGAGSVGRNTDGIVRLTIMRHGRGDRGLYRVRETLSPAFEDASREIISAMYSAAYL